ncbi:MAG: twin-arginine translocase TatA/TatE family subunit, partial [archaeon]|nr:twin-arginine translocase TatA/TatE family subunit [archaeon]
MAAIGGTEVMIIIVVFFLLFGAKRLPEMANALGRSKGEFQRGLDEATRLP